MRMHRSLGPYSGGWRKNRQETDADVTVQLPRVPATTGPLSVAMRAEQPTGFDRRIAAEMTVEDLVVLRDEIDALIEATRSSAAVANNRSR